MNKRCFNIIDLLINRNTDHNRLIINMVCIFFDFGKELFGNEYLIILREYLIDNNRTVDDIVENSSISYSGYYRKLKVICYLLLRMSMIIKEAFIELKIDDNYINMITSDESF